jgi:hypothetical protein
MFGGIGTIAIQQVRRVSLKKNLPAIRPAARTEINDPIGLTDDGERMF